MPVRPMRAADRRQVIAMMRALWPDERGFLNPQETRREKVLVWVGSDGHLGGFISFSVRPFANGCDTMPVPFVEGWYVLPAQRRLGVGGELMRAVEQWSAAHGYRELGSDTDLWRRVSIKAHAALGFELTDRVQYFRKKLRRRPSGPAAPRAPRPARRGRGRR
ncbi:MAG TPA: GNAT family N-acetyltransferase [bacterium]